MNALSDWTEDYNEAIRWANLLKQTVRYVRARLRVAKHEANGRTYYRVEEV